MKTAVRAALDAGYRHIDTAYNYKNEDAIGEVLQEYIKSGKVKREDLFIVTKVHVNHVLITTHSPQYYNIKKQTHHKHRYFANV